MVEFVSFIFDIIRKFLPHLNEHISNVEHWEIQEIRRWNQSNP